ncbi:MAG TPA: hypothetical protein ENI69_04440 [Rhodospirillales bacterium]|nr:hypothetical protein [Rhodospirillales bacterium]
MNEQEILALLTGERNESVFVCRVSQDQASAIGAKTTEVWLSRATVIKQESKHYSTSKDLYFMVPRIIAKGFVRFQPPHHMIFILHEKTDKTRSFKAVVKATKTGHELYLVSIHRVARGDVRAVYRRTTSLEKWKRKRREVGPPRNPT